MEDHKYFVSKFVKSGGVFKPGTDAAGKPIAGRDYYGAYPKHALLNFLAAPSGQDPKPNTTELKKLKNVPYWVGVAASGYHSFPGQGTRVRDSHVGRNPNDKTNIENRPFEKLAYAWDSVAGKPKTTPDGRPVYSEQLSGIIVVPPGSWPR